MAHFRTWLTDVFHHYCWQISSTFRDRPGDPRWWRWMRRCVWVWLAFSLCEHEFCIVFTWYCGWKKSCTTFDGWTPINNGINHQSTGAGGFLPPTVCMNVFVFVAVWCLLCFSLMCFFDVKMSIVCVCSLTCMRIFLGHIPHVTKINQHVTVTKSWLRIRPAKTHE